MKLTRRIGFFELKIRSFVAVSVFERLSNILPLSACSTTLTFMERHLVVNYSGVVAFEIGVAGGNFTLRLLGISGLTAEDSSHTVRFLQSQTIPISNPYAVTCLPRKDTVSIASRLL